MKKNAFYWLITVCWLSAGLSHAQVQWGRDLEDRRTFSVTLSGGMMFNLDGEVQETERPIEVIGGPTSGSPPENYSWSELGFDDRFPAYGFGMEKLWRYVSVRGQFLTGSPSVSSVADRDYYIGVDRVRFESRNYEYMVIPEGSEFSGDIDLYSFDLQFAITPVSFGSADSFTFTPWIHLGLYTFLADYEVRAGAPQEVTQYENPPRDYVVGGRGTGTTGLLVPELGLGAEFGIPLSARSHLYLSAHAAFLRFSGSNSSLGVRSRNEKDLDVRYHSIGARALFEWEINQNLNFIAGAEFKYMTGEAEVRAIDRPEEEILALREKFDKDVDFEVSALTAFIGLRF